MSNDLLDEVQQLRRMAEQALSSTTTSASVPFPQAERPPLAAPAPSLPQHRHDLPYSHGAATNLRSSTVTTGTTAGDTAAVLNREIEAIASTGFSGVAHAQHTEPPPLMIDRPPSLCPPSTGTEQSRFDMAVLPLGFGSSRQPSTGGGGSDTPPELPNTSRSHSTQPHTPSPQRATFAPPTQNCDGRTDVSVFPSDTRRRSPTMNESDMNHRSHFTPDGQIPIHSTHHESTQSPAAPAGVYDGPLFPPETPPARPVALSAFAHSPAALYAAALDGDRDFPTPAFQRAHQRPSPQPWTATASPETRRHHTVVPDSSSASPSNSGPMLDGGLSAFGVPTPARPLRPRDVATGHPDHAVPRAGEHQPLPGAVAITAAGQRSIGCNTDDLPRKSIATATSRDLQSDASEQATTGSRRARNSVAAVAIQAEAAVSASAVQTVRLDTAVKSTECAILSHAELDAATTKIAELMEEIDSLRCASAQGTSQQERLTVTVESLRAELVTSQEQLRIETLERSRCEVELSDFKRKEEQNRSATAVEIASLRSALEKLQAENVAQRQATAALQGEKEDVLLMVDVLKRKANEPSSHLREMMIGGTAASQAHSATDATASVSALRLECAELQGTVEALSAELTRTGAARDALHELVVSMSHDGDEYAAPPPSSFSSSPYLLLENTGPDSRSQSPRPRNASPPAEPWHQSYPGHPYQRYHSSLSPSSSSATVPRFSSSRDASMAVTTSRQSSRERQQQRGLSTAGASVSGASVRSRSTQPTTARRRGSELSTSTQALGRRGAALMDDRSIHPHFTDCPKPDDTAGGGGVAFSADAVKGLSSAETAMMLLQCDRLLAM